MSSTAWTRALCSACQAVRGDPIWSCLSGQLRPFLKSCHLEQGNNRVMCEKKVKADPRGLSSVKNGKVKPSDTIAEHDARAKMDILFHGWSQHFLRFPSTV